MSLFSAEVKSVNQRESLPSDPSDCPSVEELTDFAAGRLSHDDAERLGTHIDGCERCGETIDAIGAEDDTLLGDLQHGDLTDPILNEAELREGLRKVARPRKLDETLDDVSSETEIEAVPRDAETRFDGLERQLGNYRLISKLGQGGMGAVYKAVHTSLDKVVALKVLTAGRLGDINAIKRFQQEMKATGRVQHSNVVIAHDAGEVDGHYFLVMEYVDGTDISKVISERGDEQGRLPMALATNIVRQAATGIQHAHDQGLIHRDIKPSNLMLDTSGVVKVLDLGLARVDESLGGSDRINAPNRGELTHSGSTMGTIGYMSPEQAMDSSKVECTTDVYSLGATLFKLLAGTLPFPSEQYDTVGKMVVAIATGTPDSLSEKRPDLPDELVRIVEHCLTKDPKKRIQSAGELAKRLAPFATASDPDKTLPALPIGSPKHAAPRTRLLRRLLAVALLPILFFGIQFLIRTEHGSVLVEIEDERVEAKLSQAGIRVVDERNEAVWTINTKPASPKRLAEGNYKFVAPAGLLITDESGTEINGTEFRLVDADKRLRIRVSLVSPESEAREQRLAEQQEKQRQANERLEVARWIESVGGKMFETGPGSREVTSKMVAEKGTNIGFVSLSRCGELERLGERLAKLPSLKVVFADGTSFDRDDLVQLLKNRNIYWVKFSYTRLTSADFPLLRGFPRLNSLGINGTQVQDGWDFMKSMPWLPEIQLSADSFPEFDRLCEYKQLDTIWIEHDFTLSGWDRSEMIQEIEEARQGNAGVRIGLNNSIVGVDVVRETAKQLAEQGWQLAGMYSNWQDGWNSSSNDAWDESRWFHVFDVIAPNGVRWTPELAEDVSKLGHAFNTLSFQGAEGTEHLATYLRRRVITHLDVRDSDLSDTELEKIAEMSGIRRLTVTQTNVTGKGVWQFEKQRPRCKVISDVWEPRFGGDPLLDGIPWASFASNKQQVPEGIAIDSQPLVLTRRRVDEFDLEFTAQRTSKFREGLGIRFEVQGKPVSAILGGWGAYFSALESIDGKRGDRSKFTSSGDPFADAKPHRVRVSVREQSLQVQVDGKPLLSWNGDPSRLSVIDEVLRDQPRISLRGYNRAEFEIKDIWFQPRTLQLAATDSVPLIKTVGKEYEFTFNATRLTSSPEAMIIHLLVDGNRATVLFAGYSGEWSALQQIDGKWGKGNETSVRYDPFADGEPHRVRIKVAADSVQAWIDDRSVIQWQGDPARLNFAVPGSGGQGGVADADVSVYAYPPVNYEMKDFKVISNDAEKLTEQ
ncbi:MAG: protein kinase [Planctomycetota bacterium]